MKFIPPHQSLVRQLPPKGKPSLRCANMVNTELSGKYSLCFCPFTLLRSTKRDFAKRLPLGGKLSHKRLMRGDKSAPHRDVSCNRTGTTHGSFPTTHHFQQVTRFAGAQSAGNAPRVVPRARPPTKRARSRTLQQIHTSPNTKNFPHVSATLEKRNKSSLRKWRGHGGSSR